MAGESPQVIVLLGAGASRDANIPTTDEMTIKVLERIKSLGDPRYALGLEYVLHTLAADAAAHSFLPLPFGLFRASYHVPK